MSAVVQPHCSQGWSTLGACTSAQKWESPKITPPSLPSDFPWAGVISYNPCLELSCSCLSSRAAQGSVPATAGWVCSSSSANRNSPGVACSSLCLSAVLPSFHLQLFKTYLPKSHLLLAQAKGYFSQQSEISPIFPQTFLNETLKGYLQVAATFCN